jgi:hypothetical protein
MKIKICYATKLRRYSSKNTYQNVFSYAELTPVKISRRPCGSGCAANRFYYVGIFEAPDDANFVSNGLITENINRKTNPHFRPKDFNWIGNVAVVEQSGE